MSLKTDYRDDIYEGSRRWRLTQNEDGTYGISDATTYTQKGDSFGQNDINATNRAVNALRNDIKVQHLKTTDAIELYAGLIKSDSELTVAQKAEKIKIRRKYLNMIDDAECNTDGILTVTSYSKKPATEFAVWLRGCSAEEE